MGTVLPPWKLELIEKKRKRLEQEKAKEQEKIDKYSNIPEWKRSILSKRKSEEHFSLANDSKPNVKNDQIQNSQPSSRKVSQQSFGEGRVLQSEISSSNEKVAAKDILKNGDLEGHSFVANGVSQLDKQKQDDRNKLSSRHTSHESDSEEDEGRVLYEHIKTPSELKRLYELRVAKRKALEEASNKEPPSSTRSKSLNSSQINREENIANHINTEIPTKGNVSEDAEVNGVLAQEEIVKETQKIKLVEEQSLQADNPPATSEINHENAIVSNNAHDKKELQNGGDTSSEIHVEVIRSKFGPSGSFRKRSSSTDNLLSKSSPEHTTPLGSPKPRPSPLNKRWSMISLTKGSDSSEDHGALSRARSLSDILNEPAQADSIYLRHRASVSHDIEHRIHELLHHGAVFDGNTSDEWDEDEMLSKVKQPHSPVPKKNEEPPKERRASWFTSEQVSKATEAIHISYLPQGEKSLSSLKSETKTNYEQPNKSLEERNEVANLRPTNTVSHSTKKEETKEKGIVVHNAESNESLKADFDDSDIELVNNVSADDQNSKGPSVHKLSALFGSSILKGNKKSKTNNNVDSKNDSCKPTTKEPKSDNKSDSKGTSRKFPWTKKSDNNTSVKNTNNSNQEGSNYLFKGAQGLKPVQNREIDQKSGSNVALVIGGGSKNNQTYNNAKKPTTFSNTPAVINNSITPSKHATKKASNDCEDKYITVIDVPDTASHDIQVSAIDIPEAHSPTPVSVIDMPETKDSGLKVSIIDRPQDSDSDSDSETSGCYEVNPSMFTFQTDSSESRDDEEEEEDIDNVPVSYYGDSTYMTVPEIIFESEREDVKSILSSQLRKRKVNISIPFNFITFFISSSFSFQFFFKTLHTSICISTEKE